MPPALGDLVSQWIGGEIRAIPADCATRARCISNSRKMEKGSENLETNDNTTHLFFDCPGAGVHRVN
jgi:hypothetical protein